MAKTTWRQDESIRRKLVEHLFDGDLAWVLDVVSESVNPEDVFEFSVLEDWAKEHGFILKDEVNCE